MKATHKLSILLTLFTVLFSCTSSEKQSELPVIDVTKSYPKKEIILQDIAKVEYIPLETRDDVLLDGNANLYTLSSDSILIGNNREGSIFLFDEKGKCVNKFKHKGQSGQEYQEIWGVFYDEKTAEIFVLDNPMLHRFQVYDNEGNHKRELAVDDKYSFMGMGDEILNYDDASFLCYNRGIFIGNSTTEDTVKTIIKPFALLSKENGKEIKSLPITLTKRVETNIIIEKSENRVAAMMAKIHPVIDNGKFVILSEVSKDTIFSYSKDAKLEPIAIRTPEILTMNEPLSFFQIEKMTPQYLWGEIIGKGTEQKNKFTNRKIVIDRATNEIFEYTIINTDVPKADLNVQWFLNNHISFLINADRLKDLLEEGKLKGKLKEIAESINIDDNPVLIKVKFKE